MEAREQLCKLGLHRRDTDLLLLLRRLWLCGWACGHKWNWHHGCICCLRLLCLLRLDLLYGSCKHPSLGARWAGARPLLRPTAHTVGLWLCCSLSRSLLLLRLPPQWHQIMNN